MSNIDSCGICQLDLALVDKVKQLYHKGKDADEIGMELGLDISDVRNHCQDCIKRPKSQQERYRELIDQLEDDVGHARQAMLDNSSSPGLQQGYARLVAEYRNAVEKNDELTRPEDVVRDLVIRVVNPMVKDSLKGLTEEIVKLRMELHAAGIPAETATKLLEEFFKNAAVRLKTTINSAVANMNSYFGAIENSSKENSASKTLQ